LVWRPADRARTRGGAPPRRVLATVRPFWRWPEERELLGREDPAATMARAQAGDPGR
jgi:hypothetical protein